MKIIDVERWVTYELIWVISVSTIWDIFNKLLGKQKLTPKPTMAGPNYGSPDQPTVCGPWWKCTSAFERFQATSWNRTFWHLCIIPTGRSAQVNYDKNANFQHRFSQNYKNATYAPLPLSWHCHCKSSPGSSDECSTSAGWPPTFVPSRSAWASDQPKLATTVLHSPLPFITSQPKWCWTSRSTHYRSFRRRAASRWALPQISNLLKAK